MAHLFYEFSGDTRDKKYNIVNKETKSLKPKMDIHASSFGAIPINMHPGQIIVTVLLPGWW